MRCANKKSPKDSNPKDNMTIRKKLTDIHVTTSYVKYEVLALLLVLLNSNNVMLSNRMYSPLAYNCYTMRL